MGWPAPQPHNLRRRERAEGAMQISVLGIDLGKNSCSVVGLDEAGRIVLRRRLSRARVIELSSQLPACVMAMDACCGAHHLGRILAAHGHRVRLMSPEYVQPYVKAQKNDESSLAAGGRADSADQPTAGSAARARHHRRARTASPGTIPFTSVGRRRGCASAAQLTYPPADRRHAYPMAGTGPKGC